MNSSSNNSSDFSNGVANNTSSPAPITEPEHGGGSSNLLIGFLLVAATGVVLCGLVVFYIQRKKRERLRLAFKPIYNTEGDDDWDINVQDPTVQVKDTARLTPTKQHKMPFSSTATDLNNSHQQQPSKTRSIGGKSGGGPAQINNRATLQFNLNGADTEDVPHPEVTQPPQTKFTTT